MTADTTARKNAEPRPTVPDLRRRARNRLIGSALLVIAAIVLFSFLFDSQPRSETDDVDFAIPEQGQVKPIGTAEGQREIADLSSSSGVAVPLDAPAAVPGSSDGDTGTGTGADAAGRVDGAESLSPDESFVGTWDDGTAAQERAAAARANIARAEQQAREQQQIKEQQQAKERQQAKRQAEQEKADKARAEAEAAKKAQKKAQSEAARVQAILSGEKEKRRQAQQQAGRQNTTKTAASETATDKAGRRYIVQFGSLKDPARAEAVRAEVASKGLSAYTQTANTSKGTYTRLRSGPYSSKAAADAAAAKIKALGHPVLVKRQ